MELFYNKHIDSQTKEFILEKEENNHIIKVLRKKQGDICLLYTSDAADE